MRRGMLLIVLFAALTMAGGGSAGAQGPDTIATLTRQVQEMVAAGRVIEALPLASRVIDLIGRERGPDDIDLANAVTVLALLHVHSGDYAHTEPLYRQAP